MIMLKTLGQYYIWAHNKYREAFQNLTIEEFERIDTLMGKSIRELLEHVLLITKYGFFGEDAMMEYGDIILEMNKNELLEEWKNLDDEVAYQLANPGEGLKNLITLTGENIELPLEEYYLIFTDHMTFHRGQFLTALKHLGKPGISSDLYYFKLEQYQTVEN